VERLILLDITASAEVGKNSRKSVTPLLCIIGVAGKIGYELQNSVWCEDLSFTVLHKPVWEMAYLYKELDLREESDTHYL
jgi:hypothetical protein